MITLKLDKLKWEALHRLVSGIADKCPVDGYELESFVLLEMYKRLISAFTFFKPNTAGVMTLRIKYMEAYAINNFWAPRSDTYNILLRPQIEGKLPPSKTFE